MVALSKIKNTFTDEKTKKKCLKILNILNNLQNSLLLSSNYDELFRTIDSYTFFLADYIKDNNLIYFLRDNVYDLVNHIKKNIIYKKEVTDEKLKQNALVMIFKLANCFQILDVFLEFINILRSSKYPFLEINTEMNSFLKNVSHFRLVFSKTTKFETSDYCDNFDVMYNKTLDFSRETALCCDGKFLYYHIPAKGLYKIGTGKNNTIKGRIYAENPNFKLDAVGTLAICCETLFFRSEKTAPYPFIALNPDDLSEVFFA